MSEAASLTVVIPVWDGYVGYLSEAARSVLEDAPEVEVLVVDNASADPLPELQNVRIIRTPHRLSVGDARNFGLERVRTENVLVLDADDTLVPGTLRFLASRLDADASLALCATTILDAETGRRHRAPRRFVTRLVRCRRTFALADAVWSLLPIQGCAAFRVRAALDAGGYADSNWADDWVLAVSLAFRGRVELHERPGRCYRATKDSISMQERTNADLRASARLVRDRLRTDPGVDWARRWLPVIWLLQNVAVFIHPIVLMRRRLGIRASGD